MTKNYQTKKCTSPENGCFSVLRIGCPTNRFTGADWWDARQPCAWTRETEGMKSSRSRINWYQLYLTVHIFLVFEYTYNTIVYNSKYRFLRNIGNLKSVSATVALKDVKSGADSAADCPCWRSEECRRCAQDSFATGAMLGCCNLCSVSLPWSEQDEHVFVYATDSRCSCFKMLHAL